MIRDIKTLAFLILILISGCHEQSDYTGVLNSEEIKNKLESARDGDIVNIPAGTLTIDEEITISKNIHVKGAGIDKTIIISNVTTANKCAVQFNVNNDNPFRVSDMTIKGSGNTSNGVLLEIKGTNERFRLDHVKFENGNCPQAITVKGLTYGVIDHCEFLNSALECVNVMDGLTGEYAWNENYELGTWKSVYLEDCIFTQNNNLNFNAVCSNQGSRYVFRHNTISIEGTSTYPLCDAHGNYDITGSRGSYSLEIYDNTFNVNTNLYNAFFLRGGRGVVYNNTINGNISVVINLYDYRSANTKTQYLTKYPGRKLFPHWDELPDELQYSTDHPNLLPDIDYCDNVYPAPDQINNLYIWNNIFNGSQISPTVRDVGLNKDHIQKDRDYFEYAMPGYSPYIYPHPLTKE
jgi:hypothetical protein